MTSSFIPLKKFGEKEFIDVKDDFTEDLYISESEILKLTRELNSYAVNKLKEIEQEDNILNINNF